MSEAQDNLATVPPRCAECGGGTVCVSGDQIYPHRPDLFRKWFWRCPCGAYVGCHPNSQTPLGTPAGPATRQARSEAHAVFDALWQRKMARDGVSRHEARNAAYAWLAEQMGLDPSATHIGSFTQEQCAQVVALCRPYLPRSTGRAGR